MICICILTFTQCNAQDLTSNQQEKIDFYMSKLHTAESSAVEKQGAFTSEIEGLKRLVDLYKRYFEEASAKVADLEQHEAVIRETNANVLKSLRDKISLQVRVYLFGCSSLWCFRSQM